MTRVGYNFNDFSENELTKLRAVLTVLRRIIVHGQWFGGAKPSNPLKTWGHGRHATHTDCFVHVWN